SVAAEEGGGASSRHRRPAPRQPYRELGEVARFAVDCDGAAMLLGYDLVADRQAKSRTFAGRLGRKEGLEQFLPILRRNTDPIVTYPNLDTFAELAGCDLQRRAEQPVALAAALGDGVESVADKV